MNTAVTVGCIISQDVIEKTLACEFGENAQLTTFKVEDLSSGGNNFNSSIKRIQCIYRDKSENISKSVTYFAKTNPNVELAWIKTRSNTLFKREINFLTVISSKINSILAKGIPPTSPISVPRPFYSSSLLGEEVMICRDLAEENYMVPKAADGLTNTHINFIMRELAKIHAGSYIFKEILKKDGTTTNMSDKSILLSAFPSLLDTTFTTPEICKQRRVIIEGLFDAALGVVENIAGYENVYKKMKDMRDNVYETYQNQLKESDDRFEVICHGDCWLTNFMFRYDEERNPKDIMLLDLQIARIGSIATDFNYFFYTSVGGNQRSPKQIQTYLNHYYNIFCDILNSHALSVPFSLDELLQEYYDKNNWGFLNSLFIVPFSRIKQEDIYDLSKINDEMLNDFIKHVGKEVSKACENHESFKKIYMSLFDHLL